MTLIVGKIAHVIVFARLLHHTTQWKEGWKGRGEGRAPEHPNEAPIQY